MTTEYAIELRRRRGFGGNRQVINKAERFSPEVAT